ncbi:MAG: FtsW/RodA/SpoVE family cell cycle protein [Candidatus Campbellbacteria bacterium]|nr:FtsW/RodA/SpoVE family cell cycle protein [Candidatus Campbellbacteria bacterium]
MSLSSRKTTSNIKWALFLTIALAVIGTITLYSALLGRFSVDAEFNLLKPILSQGVAFVLGTIVLLIMWRFVSYKLLRRYCLYIILAAFGFVSLVFVPELGGDFSANRWILIGTYSFQPTEILKIAVVIFVSALFASMKNGNPSPYHLISLGVLFVALSALAYLQPDIGTFLVIVSSIIGIMIASSLKFRWYVIAAIIVIPVIAFFAFGRGYTFERLETHWKVLLGTVTDEELNDAAYQVNQSKLTIGSGGLWGRGFASGAQKFGFLPESSTDSIFSVFLEEWGFVGGSFLIFLFMSLLYRFFSIARNASDQFGSFLAVGIAVLIGTQIFINILVQIGLFPLTGIPLPFFSKGGSVIIGTLLGIGILLNIAKHSKHR